MLEQNLAVTNDKCVLFDKTLCAWLGFLDGQCSRIFCAAEFLYRTDVAFRFIRQANKCTKIDKRGIKMRRIALRDELRGIRPKFFAADRRIDRDTDIEQSGEHTRAIRFNDWHPLIESEGCNCVRNIAASAGQFTNRSDVAGQNPPVLIPNNPGSGSKVSRAIVITEPLPGVKHGIFRSACDGSEIRKPVEPFIIIGNYRGDLGLLEHELGYENGIRVAPIAPWEFTAIMAKPAEKRAAKDANASR